MFFIIDYHYLVVRRGGPPQVPGCDRPLQAARLGSQDPDGQGLVVQRGLEVQKK